jgi:oligopeptide/dipeptide ABC transporter ATP-binding protein
MSSLNPRMPVSEILAEPLRVHRLAKGADLEARVDALLGQVGIPQAWRRRYPHEFSGGQRQRIGVARAIALGPKLVVCDEAVSALDVSIQAQILNLLIELREELGLAYLFISHDLSVVRHLSARIAVMYLGRIVEVSGTQDLFDRPAHPYTQALLSAIPVPDPTRRHERIVLGGDVPSPMAPPPGCRFHTRCPIVMDRCRRDEPPSVEVAPGHTVRCFAVGEGSAARS